MPHDHTEAYNSQCASGSGPPYLIFLPSLSSKGVSSAPPPDPPLPPLSQTPKDYASWPQVPPFLFLLAHRIAAAEVAAAAAKATATATAETELPTGGEFAELAAGGEMGRLPCSGSGALPACPGPDPNLEGPFEEMTLVKAGWLWRQKMQLPEGHNQDCLLIVYLRDGLRLTMCADTKDEALAWKIALQESHSTPVRIYDPYDDYYQMVPPNAHDATYIRTGTPYGAPGMTHVILRDSPYYRRDTGGDIAMGMLAGAATGAALGSLMWMPCWF
ncbi:pleckstrin homology domain-containing family B member 1 [Gracilinanus agilis]|uniref:pleckstrin homology domain-containing family B member 1 n=1 Tax=Gracilinanus agilis TaxID=191870 RepID=UPI001CFE78C4|nr:pleckstrin homology domain-containing family B member 1 [Gracilinanus agilis]